MTCVCRMTYIPYWYFEEKVNNVLVRSLKRSRNVLLVTYWFADCFWPKILDFFSRRVKIIILCKVRLNPHKVRLSRTSDGWRGSFVAVSDQLSCCPPSWMSTITRNHKDWLPWLHCSTSRLLTKTESWMTTISKNHKNGCNHSAAQHRDSQRKLNMTKFVESSTGTCLQPLPKSQKWSIV